ncbi:GTP-binding protein [Puniceicoccaceae bacterium K14]|nr:GTP-binding protein [Puniceicoccaceae bacterium K14]
MEESTQRNQSETNVEGGTPDRRIPLVLLGGFLGAGKTTVLNYLMGQAKGRRIAALVNDVGEINIDAALARDLAVMESRSTDGIVELSNGCICCGLQGEFSDSVIKLAQKSPDLIIVEATGIAEPQRIVANLSVEDEEGVSPMSFVRLINVVTVVDAEWWVEKVEAAYKPMRRSLLRLSDPRKPLSELLTMQVEGSDVIILNKTDLADEEKLRRSQAALAAMNPTADIFLAKEGEVAPEELLEVERFDIEVVLQSAPYSIALQRNAKATGVEVHDHGEFGLTAFVYEARWPMTYNKLVAFLRKGVPGLLRAKGFAWTDNEPDRIGYFSLASEVLRFDHIGKWMHASIENGELDRSQIPGEIFKKWDRRVGDRRQEIVFIGVDLDRAKIVGELDRFLIKENDKSL